jgi:hypothetical protein
MKILAFIKLNDDIVINMLSNWCNIFDIVKLDSAFCVEDQRNTFLSFMKDQRMLAFRLHHFYPKNNYKWFYLRQVKFKDLIVMHGCQSLEDIPIKTYVNIVTLSFVGLRLNCNTTPMLTFMNSCPSLLHLSVDNCNSGMERLLSRVKCSVWQSLTKLSLNFPFLFELIEIIGIHCCRLTALELLVQILNETHLKAIMMNNPSLSEISLGGKEIDLLNSNNTYGVTASYLDFLIPNCLSNIVYLNLVLIERVNLQTLFPLLDGISRLTKSVRLRFKDLGSLSSEIEFYCHSSEEDINVCIFDLEDSDSDKLCRGLLKTLDLVGKSALFCRGCMDELWERHKVVPFVFIEKLALIRLSNSLITDVLFSNILKANPRLEAVCLDIGVSEDNLNYLSVQSSSGLPLLKIIRVLYLDILKRPRAATILF